MTPIPNARRLFPLTILLLIVLGFAPLRFVAWVGWFGRVAQFLVAPVSAPLAAAARWLAPAEARQGEPEEVSRLEDELAAQRVELLRMTRENGRLRGLIEELQRGFALAPDLAVRQFAAPVYGRAGDTERGPLSVRAGRREGVGTDTVATALGMQLFGRVSAAEERTCTVVPITSRAAGPLRGRVIVDNSPDGLVTELEPVGDGTLRGPVEDRRDGTGGASGEGPVVPEVGQTVRLDDPGRWPASAQMLVIGRVERVEPAPGQPLRKVIVVRPTIERLDRVSEVVLRISVAAGGGADDADGGAP